MRVTPRLLEAKPTEDWRMWVRFEDGLAAEVDLSYVLDYGGVFRPVHDPDYFRQVAIYPGGATIYWPNEADIAPETLYRRTREAAGVTA
jgi:Protein of unknown function (DUF2442)